MKHQETTTTSLPAFWSLMVSETFDGGQYRNTDLPTMFSTGSGPLEKPNKNSSETFR